jgi:hypothetical protein
MHSLVVSCVCNWKAWRRWLALKTQPLAGRVEHHHGYTTIIRAGACALPRIMTPSAHVDLPKLIPGPLAVLKVVPSDTEALVVGATTASCTRC